MMWAGWIIAAVLGALLVGLGLGRRSVRSVPQKEDSGARVFPEKGTSLEDRSPKKEHTPERSVFEEVEERVQENIDAMDRDGTRDDLREYIRSTRDDDLFE